MDVVSTVKCSLAGFTLSDAVWCKRGLSRASMQQPQQFFMYWLLVVLYLAQRLPNFHILKSHRCQFQVEGPGCVTLSSSVNLPTQWKTIVSVVFASLSADETVVLCVVPTCPDCCLPLPGGRCDRHPCNDECRRRGDGKWMNGQMNI